ncbi:MAG: hypothetical protein HOV81_00310 [Kofleriaceae bacterium]|nr:hypothetical protein [Kofleriaceae bacterium]
MRDLDLHERLVADSATVEDLRVVAGWPLARRAPYLDRVAPYASHGDVAMRAAALSALAGARGHEGVRAIVGGLGDDDADVRAAALASLREVAKDAPERYAHALFHGRVDVRRAALTGELPMNSGKLAIYLRADREVADLVRTLRWPEKTLGVALELYAQGHVGAAEIAEHLLRTPWAELRELLLLELRRPPEVVDAYLDHAALHGAGPATGHDVLDRLVAALGESGNERALEQLVDTIQREPKDAHALARRAAVSLLAHLAGRDPASASGLVAACVALEPRMVSHPTFTAALAPAAVRGLVRYQWPIKPVAARVEKLLALPVVRADLALAAAVAGLLHSRRLATLAEILGEDWIVERLSQDDHGWEQICRLPAEHGALELRWLARVGAIDYKRYITLAGQAFGAFTGKRLEEFVDQLPRRHRPGVFAAALERHATAGDHSLASVCKAIAARIDRTTLLALLRAQLTAGADRLALALVRAVPAKMLENGLGELSDADAAHLCELMTKDAPPREHELAILAAFTHRADPAIAAWRKLVEIVQVVPTAVTVAPSTTRRALTGPEIERIRKCSDVDLGGALAPTRNRIVTGLCDALAARSPAPNLAACVALLGCADPIELVAAQLDRFSEPTPAFDAALDNAACAWLRYPDAGPLVNARLWRWEKHSFDLIDQIETAPGGLLAWLVHIESLRGRVVRDTMWKGTSEALMLLRYRDVPRFARLATLELGHYCAVNVDRDIGRHAARIVVALVESGAVPIEAVRGLVLDRVADADASAREYISRLVRLVGVPEAPRPVFAPSTGLVEQIRTCTDLDELALWCADPRPAIVQEAALALVVLGAPGQERLAEVLQHVEDLPASIPLLESIQLWDHEPALAAVRVLAAREGLPPASRFHIHLNLLARGEKDSLAAAIEAVRAEPDRWYFRRDDWDALVKVTDVVTCSLALVDSPHHHAYQRALDTLLSLTRPTEEVRDAMRRFLLAHSERPLHLRVSAARFLGQHWSDPLGIPLLVEYMCDERADDWMYTLETVPRASMPAVARAIAGAALVGGSAACSEKRLWQVIQRMRSSAHVTDLADLDLRILENASTNTIRRSAAKYVTALDETHARVGRVAEVFAWGVRRGVELAGRLFSFHLTSKEREFGHTKVDGTKIFVSALPMLRGEPHGRDIVEGLVLHELGHHVYHRSERAQEIWKQAHAEGIGHFLNLVADEHLERNLRAHDPAYGDRLKRLGAYAFHHAPQEIKLATLTGSLRAATATALIAADLEVAYDEASVRLRRGAVLSELDRAGHPVARFARSLRMGLGNRSGDPLNAAALAMCGKELRALDMQGLYDLTKRLVSLFGGTISIAQVFGGPEGLEFGERDDDVYGDVDDAVLQREVERILDPRRSKRAPATGPLNRLQINVSPDASFDEIKRIVRVNGDPELHRPLASAVQRHSTRLRAYLDDLGLRWEPMRARTQGRALDRTRLRALVTRNDPRILVARNPVRRTDLFLGTLIDCSGSMQAGQNIERARRFAILVAEAVRALPGVEARFFGFTDSVIYDAGNAADCGVVSLKADGGNNDAAALYHAANVAMASAKRARVLVMISDGLPTECSTVAVKELVTQLTRRRNIVCAQVAVRKLDEVCFPNYVVLDDQELDLAVAKFGRMIADLARRSLAS